MTDEAVTIERTLGATKIAQLFGRKGGRRTVTGWANAGCPCDVQEGGRGARLFNFLEVKTWLDGEGLSYKLSEEANRLLPKAARPGQADSAESTGEIKTGNAGGNAGGGGGVVADAEASLKTLADTIRNVNSETMTPAQATQLSRALSAVSTELRHLRKEELERRERMGELIELADAQEATVQAIALVVTDICSLSTTLPHAILTAFDKGGVVISDQEKAVRLIADTIIAATDEVRTRRAKDINETHAGDGREAA